VIANTATAATTTTTIAQKVRRPNPESILISRARVRGAGPS
jgi:hypothetical protein